MGSNLQVSTLVLFIFFFLGLPTKENLFGLKKVSAEFVVVLP
jgi:hypothetical protein